MITVDVVVGGISAIINSGESPDCFNSSFSGEIVPGKIVFSVIGDLTSGLTTPDDSVTIIVVEVVVELDCDLVEVSVDGAFTTVRSA